MRSKKDTLQLLQLRPINEPSLSPSLPSNEPAEEVQSSSENFPQHVEEEQTASKDEQGSWDDTIEPLNAVEEVDRFVLWDDEIDAPEEEDAESWDDEIDAPDAEEVDAEPWDDEIDPFEHRHLPTIVEAAAIEEADIRHAFSQADTHIIEHTPVPPAPSNHPPQSRRPVARWMALPRRHKFVVVAALLVVLLVIGDGTLFLLNMTRSHASPALSGASTSPTLAVTPAMTHPGEIVTLHLTHFSPADRVLLTRDMQLPVRTGAGSSLITLRSDGHADVPVLVEDNWGAGSHLLLAEDVRSHFIASVSLQVISDFPTPLPHLVVGTQDAPNGLNAPLSFGSDLPQVNTIRSLVLRNTGGSWISWQAVSDQPWLTLAPQQGVFQESQGVFVAAERGHLAPGYHQGTITITSNRGNQLSYRWRCMCFRSRR